MVPQLPQWDGGAIFNHDITAGSEDPADGDAANSIVPPMVQVMRKFERDMTVSTYFLPPNSKYAFDTTTVPSAEHHPDDMPVFKRNHERLLLSEPWESPMSSAQLNSNINMERPMARQCLNAHNCIARHQGIDGHSVCGGLTLVEIMTPSELERFNEYGHHPHERRMCVLCMRWNMHAAYLDIRNRDVKPQNILINWYINAVGAGEYRRECCIPLQNTSGWSGLFGTVVMLQLNRYRWVQDSDTLRWSVDQSGCETGPNDQPVQLFRIGAETHSHSN